MEVILSSKAFLLLQQFIEDQCGISIGSDKAYLIESRLSKLLIDSGTESFEELYNLLSSRRDPDIIEKVIDAITTNETLWFRDSTPWLVLEEVLLPVLSEALRKGKKSKIRIWSAACSTGQEPYSIAMCIDHYLRKRNITDIGLCNFEILASDISRTVLETARTGRYDNVSIMRGLSDEYKGEYFTNQNRVWTISDKIRNAVTFTHFNLQKDFTPLGSFDIIFCRYVTIYFSEALKRGVLEKLKMSMTQDGVLFVGSSELINGYDENFKVEQYKNGVFYKLKR